MRGLYHVQIVKTNGQHKVAGDSYVGAVSRTSDPSVKRLAESAVS